MPSSYIFVAGFVLGPIVVGLALRALVLALAAALATPTKRSMAS